MVYLSRSVLPDALSHFQRALELDPTHSNAQLAAARVSLALGRPADALAYARKLLTREPANAEALLVAWRASLALNAPVEAAAFLRQAAALQPQSEEVRKALPEAQLKP